MAFGKRSGGDPRPAPEPSPESEDPAQSGIPLVRTRVTNQGGFDKGFIALAAGVVVLSAGAALAAPSVFSMFGEPAARPISVIVDGLDRDQAKLALASEAFPDAEGRAFLETLAVSFPDSHNRLLGNLADAARAGGDRDDLMTAVNEWGVEFSLANFEYAGRMGAEGFDGLLTVVSDALDAMKSEAGACSLDNLMKLAEDEQALQAFSRYGSAGYKAGMRANRVFVDLAARGRRAPKPDTRLTADDENAVQSVFVSFLTDPQLMGAMRSAMQFNGGDPDEMRQAMAAKIDVCQLGRSLVHKLQRLPSGTKGRLLAAATSGGLAGLPGPMMDLQGFGRMR